MWVVGSNIVIGLYILDMWSVLCVLYVGGGGLNIVYECTCWTYGQCCVFSMWVVGPEYSDRTVLYWTCGQCCVFSMWVVGSKIVIGLYILDMWSVLCVLYVGGGV